jgi:hypothetical protein
MGHIVVGPPPSHIIETEIDGDISLYDPSNERVIVLNGTASDVWRLADGEMTLDAIVEALARAYSTPRDAIMADVEKLVVDLTEQGLLPAA